MQWPYGIGLDIGVASVGWTVVALNDQAQPCGFIRLGSRIFPRAEQPKTGESLAAPRRMARSMRRRIRRKALRQGSSFRICVALRPGVSGNARVFLLAGARNAATFTETECEKNLIFVNI